MTNEQRKRIFGMAIQMGIYEKGNKDDNLHAVVLNTTGKTSLSQLTETEADEVIVSLLTYSGKPKVVKATKESSKEHRPGMITPDQAKKAWYFMYELAKFDKEKSKISLGFRLCKIIEKSISITAFEKDPFRFVTFQQANVLIEYLKKMVNYEARRQVNSK